MLSNLLCGLGTLPMLFSCMLFGRIFSFTMYSIVVNQDSGQYS